MRLFTPARYDGLPGMPYPGNQSALPTASEFADYLEAYAERLGVPMLTGTRARRLRRAGELFAVDTDHGTVLADNVVVATGHDAGPQLPSFASDLDPGIVQLHSVAYRRPGQLPDGDVLVVGAGNSGADIAVELAATHHVLLAGRHPGEVPWHVGSPASRPLTAVLFWAFRHVLTVDTPVGRRARPKALAHSAPLIRVKSADLAAAGVERVPRVEGSSDGLPRLADGRVLDVASVVWCTGYLPDTSWVELPVFDESGEPRQRRGVVTGEPGLYFVGWLFQHSLSSSMIQGVGRDADRVAAHIDARMRSVVRPAAAGVPSPVG
jgi:putative flavoprotein involved in K+ transport